MILSADYVTLHAFLKIVSDNIWSNLSWRRLVNILLFFLVSSISVTEAIMSQFCLNKIHQTKGLFKVIQFKQANSFYDVTSTDKTNLISKYSFIRSAIQNKLRLYVEFYQVIIMIFVIVFCLSSSLSVFM